MIEHWPFFVGLIVLVYLAGFFTGLVLRVGREEESYQMGLAIGKRRARLDDPRPWSW